MPKQLSSLFWSFRNNQLHPSYRTLPKAFIVFRITPVQTQVNLQSSANYSYPRANPPFRRHHSSELPAVQYPRLHLKALSNNRRDIQLQSCHLFSPMLKTCNAHALNVNSYEISCMQSQPSHQQSRLLQQIHTWRLYSYANLANDPSTSWPTVQYK